MGDSPRRTRRTRKVRPLARHLTCVAGAPDWPREKRASVFSVFSVFGSAGVAFALVRADPQPLEGEGRMIEPLPDLLIQPVVRAALAEDLGRAGDITSAACIDVGASFSATFAARKPGVLAGLACARLAIGALDPGPT